MNQPVPNLAQVLQALAETSHSTPVGRASNVQSIGSNYAQPVQNFPTPPPLPNVLVKQDPSTITQWPAAVKYITTKIINDSVIMDRLNKMKVHQTEHEKLWWHNREAIVKKHQARSGNTEKMNGVLKMFGQQNIGVNAMTPEQETLELQTYDQKVHRAMTQMVTAMHTDMAKMGIPFFCNPGTNDKEDKDELRKLQKKMIDFIYDLLE